MTVLSLKRIALVAIGACWVLGALFWSSGVFIVDELLYVAATDGFVSGRGFVIWNGFEEFATEGVRLFVLRPGREGLVSQYPPGQAVLAAPLYQLIGVRAFFLLNAAGALFTLWLCYRIALLLFNDEDLALNATLVLALATFVVDYAFGIWPHCLALALETLAFYCVLRAWRGEGSGFLAMLLAGGALGLAITIRVDAAIAVGVLFFLALAILGVQMRALLGFLLGLLPGLVTASVLNFLKFGHLSPVSYGGTYGGSFTKTALFLAAAGGTAWLLYFVLRRFQPERLLLLAGLCAGALLSWALAWSPARELLVAGLKGAYVLLVDLQAYDRVPAWGVTQNPEGRLLFFGIYKKAMLQSMPFAALLLLLIPLFRAKAMRVPCWFLLLYALAWIAPFAPTQWHGGATSTLRYHLPMLPVVAILTALAWRRLSVHDAPITGRGRTAVLLGTWIGLLVYAAWVYLQGIEIAYLWRNLLPLHLALALALCALALLLLPRPPAWLNQATRILAFIAFFQATAGAYISDLHTNWITREKDLEVSAAVPFAREGSLFYGVSMNLGMAQILAPDAVFAIPYAARTNRVEFAVVTQALEAGRRVYLDDFSAGLALAQGLPAGLTLLPLAAAPDLSEIRFETPP